MKIIKDLGQKPQGNRNYRFSLFKCEYCDKEVEKIRRDGLNAKACSHKCYAANRGKRGAYKPKIMINKYCYIYKCEHPCAIGTRKLYVAEHRLVMEKHLNRYLKKDEVVHHRDENTLNNSISNLEVMKIYEHSSHHAKNRGRNKYGKFSV